MKRIKRIIRRTGLNGQHILFATATCHSVITGANNIGPTYTGHAVSPFVPVTFDNLITGVSFSQAFFDPAAGQTQLVAAIFATNVNWTLYIQDINSNTVLSATGSGMSMQFNWDGNGSGETNLAAGVYTYLLEAQTNGASGGGGSGGSGGGGSGGGPPSPDNSFNSSINATDSTTDGWQTMVVQLPPAPTGFSYGTDENGNEITTMTIELPPPEYQTHNSLRSSASSRAFSPDGVSGGGGDPPAPAASQQTQAPTRPPTAPVRGSVGTFGVGYQTYAANGDGGFSLYAPNDGSGLNERIQLEGNGGDYRMNYGEIDETASIAKNFAEGMEIGAWNSGLNLANDQLTISSLTGSGTPFNQINLGLLALHGTYGTSEDYSVNCKQMYFPIASGTSAQYLPMSQMNFGGAGSNGLKWMAIFACNSLNHTDWNSMQSQGVKPYNTNLHLLLGCDSICAERPEIFSYWPKYMTHGNSTNYSPMTIQAAWYQAATYVYKHTGQTYASTMIFAVAGDTACFGDTLQTNSTPTGTWTYNSQTVWSP